jgi:glyoxylase-like metal-dependent hydrolase (beta-lactamase superfamily II)
VLITGFASDVTATNCWVVAPGDGEQCVIVDPGIGVLGRLDEVIAEHRLHPVAVLLTHGHFDHTFSVVPVCQARDVPALISPVDRRQLSDPWTWLGIRPGTPLAGSLTFAEPDDVREIVDGEKLELAGVTFAVRSAPGHTAGSVVFGVEDEPAPRLFSGDVVFAGSIGRVDFPDGSMTDMERTLREVILPLPDETAVHPGHGPATTVGRERASNPFLQNL